MFEYTTSGGMVFGGISSYYSSYYNYVASGRLFFDRCGDIFVFSPKHLVVVQFKEGDRAWLRFEAARGRIRSVWIKRMKMVANVETGGAVVIMYIDNTNALFNEEDLITHSEAIQIALYYHQRRMREAQKALECL
jgi:hypothetical protein